jgi:predicted Zn finger-like uncharacterized protein
MIITCPHCQTKYQVTYEAIGSAGRKVQCAHCQQAWQQRPLDPVAPDEPPEPPPAPAEQAAFDAIHEDAMDDALEAEERAVSAELARRVAQEEARRENADAGKVDPAVIRKRQRAFSKRQHAVAGSMPLARLRRAARVGGVLLLAGALATAYFGRVQVVDRFPAMAGVYASVGLGVNVVGLDFSNVTTLKTLRDGKEVLIVSAQIVGLMPAPVTVPPVVVTLLDSHGSSVYEWSVTPSVRDLMANERSTFDTQLTLPPGDAARVRLSFATGGPRAVPAPAPAAAAPIESHAAPVAAEAGHAPAAEADETATTEHDAPATTHAPEPEHPAPEHH